jgi:predicted transcriptional regulator
MEEKITLLVDYINEVKTRCTYNAAAKALGITTPALKKLLGERRPEISWFVGSETEEPAGYTDEQKHAELYRTKRVIKSAEVLTRNLGL